MNTKAKKRVNRMQREIDQLKADLAAEKAKTEAMSAIVNEALINVPEAVSAMKTLNISPDKDSEAALIEFAYKMMCLGQYTKPEGLSGNEYVTELASYLSSEINESGYLPGWVGVSSDNPFLTKSVNNAIKRNS
jgi:hypothetical protein